MVLEAKEWFSAFDRGIRRIICKHSAGKPQTDDVPPGIHQHREILFILRGKSEFPLNRKIFKVKVYNHGTIEGRPYIANEYVKGQTMKDMLDFRTSIPLAEAVNYMLQLTSALFYAHQHNIIHRDIKPQNIYVMPDGTIKLGDFGIAQAEGLDDSFTKTSEIVGSVHYLAPEISQGKPASIQSDIYSAGVTFYELLTGHVPFDKDTPVNVAVAHIKEKFPPVRKYVPNCPKEVERIIANATKKRLSERYKGADEFYQDLLDISNDPSILKEKKSLLARIFGFK